MPEVKYSDYLKRIIVVITGFVLKNIANWPFDFLLYPIVLVWLGNLIGGGVMIILSFFYNIFLIKVYDWSKIDWLLIETIKGLRDEKLPKPWQRLISNVLKKSKILAFFLLCLDDPITVTLYMRDGSYKYNGLSKKDWKIFFAATIVSNLYWIIGWAALIEFVKHFILNLF